MEPCAIDISRLRVAYGETTVLHDVSLSIGSGDIALIVGGSGCGKSTLLKTIIGLNEVAAGRIRIFGEDLFGLEGARQQALLRRFGVMFQYGALLNSLSVADNVALPLQMHTQLSAPLIKDLARTRLEMVGLGHAYSRMPNELSGGMRKRAALARALALDPEILLCDEPGAGLDPVTAAGIDRMLLTINKELGTTLVVVTHELLSIERLGGRLIMLDEGRVRFDGRLAAALASDDEHLQRFFNPTDIDEGTA